MAIDVTLSLEDELVADVDTIVGQVKPTMTRNEYMELAIRTAVIDGVFIPSAAHAKDRKRRADAAAAGA